MGSYVNPGNNVIAADMRQDIYIDKSMILTELNKVFGSSTGSRLCVSRPRRFGKTMVGNLVAAYYTSGADSRPLFEKLRISKTEGWDERLNRCNVIQIDLGEFYSRYGSEGDVTKTLNRLVVNEMRTEFPNAGIDVGDSIPEAVLSAFDETGKQFVVIIDEYDVMVREKVSQADFKEFLSLLNALFKSIACGRAIGLAYLTGIIPIVRDKVQSKLNNFTEYTMLQPMELAPYIGFTLPEVKEICERYGMDYDECLRWYDGYHIADGVSICNANSVVRAVKAREFADYWSQTGAYTAISDYIDGDYEGIREDIAVMAGGGEVEVDAGSFLNTLDSIVSKDDVFTYLIHLGYLAYNRKSETCYIPNGEIRKEWERALKRTVSYRPVVEMIKNSHRLLDATIEGDSDAVAQALDKAHQYVTSPFTYNDEGALQSAIGLAYFYATTQYTVVKEFHSGTGYADIALIPYVANRPPMVIELKMNEKPERGLRQIIDNGYADAFRDIEGEVILVAISYDKKTRSHTCIISKEVI
ncbi:MAG: AAA family ATPase [Marinilabiliaceae bacterium]